MTIEQIDFKLPISHSDRYISARFAYDDSFEHKKTKQPLIIMCSGFASSLDKPSQMALKNTYNQNGFSTLQFNFLGHGTGSNKSDGEVQDTTITTGIEDLCCAWKYTQNTLGSLVDIDHVCISANSYGALVGLIAKEKGLINPESMALVAPFSFDRFRSKIIPLALLNKIYHRAAEKFLRLPISDQMIQDLRQNHLKSLLKMDKMGSTAIHFFIGKNDTVASVPTVKKWHREINQNQNISTPFMDDKQSHLIVYPQTGHYTVPSQVEKDIQKRSLHFFNKTRMVRYISEHSK